MTAVPIDVEAAKLIGETMLAGRLRLGITKAEAARRAELSRRTWHEVEAGTRTVVTAETLALIDRALEHEPGTLYAITGRGADVGTELLLRQAITKLRMMSGPELHAFIASDGLEAVTQLQADMAQLRAQVDELVQREGARASSPRARPHRAAAG